MVAEAFFEKEIEFLLTGRMDAIDRSHGDSQVDYV